MKRILLMIVVILGGLIAYSLHLNHVDLANSMVIALTSALTTLLMIYKENPKL